MLVLAALCLPGCTEVETESATGYEPATLEEGKDGLVRVNFTREGAERVGLETAPVKRAGRRLSVPYAALLYDPEGGTYVYTSPKPLSFLRVPVEVARVGDSRVLLTEGPSLGTEVVTVGVAEVYGTELEVPSH